MRHASPGKITPLALLSALACGTNPASRLDAGPTRACTVATDCPGSNDLCVDGRCISDSCAGSIADSASVQPLGELHRCKAGYSCSWQDLEVSYATCDGPKEGFKLRLVKPDAPRDPSPLMLDFPGTGECYTSAAEANEEQMRLASDGIVVAALSLRGHADCYHEGDALYRRSTWIGPDEWGDYDRLLWAFLQGWIDPQLPKVDPAHLGMGGASHGGLTTLIYGAHSAIPALTGHRIAAAMPSGATPDSAEWFLPGMDPDEVASGPSITSFGSPRLGGLGGQEKFYPGDYLDTLYQRVEADDVDPEVLVDAAFRSAHDLAGVGTSAYRDRVDASLIFMASQDCIIPKSGAFRFYEELRGDGAALRTRLLSGLGYHTCEGDAGYQPMWTQATKAAVKRWHQELKHRWIRRFLLDDTSVDLAAWPDWMYMVADEGDDDGEVPTVYAAAAPAALVTQTTTYYLGAPSALASTPPAAGTFALEHDPGACTSTIPDAPCVNRDGLAAIVFDSAPLAGDLLVVGNPKVVVSVEEATGAPYTFTAVLAEVPEGKGAGVYWPVTSERRHGHTDTARMHQQTVDLDFVVHRFRAGSRIRLVITNLSLKVIPGAVMFAPATNAFNLTFHTDLPGADGQHARLELPVATETMAPAATTWQLEGN